MEKAGRRSLLFTSMENIKLVIFDLDGTLIDAYPAITESFNYVMQKFGLSMQKPLTIRKAVGKGDRNLLKPFVKRLDLDKVLLVYRRHHRKALVKHSSLFPEVTRVLGYLKKKGYKLAVASNRPTEFSLILLKHLGLKKYFNYVLCADKLKTAKPHPAILKVILDKFKLLPYQAVYVGDMSIDAQTARRAKVRAIIVTTGSSSKKEIQAEKPAAVIKNLNSLLQLL